MISRIRIRYSSMWSNWKSYFILIRPRTTFYDMIRSLRLGSKLFFTFFSQVSITHRVVSQVGEKRILQYYSPKMRKFHIRCASACSFLLSGTAKCNFSPNPVFSTFFKYFRHVAPSFFLLPTQRSQLSVLFLNKSKSMVKKIHWIILNESLSVKTLSCQISSNPHLMQISYVVPRSSSISPFVEHALLPVSHPARTNWMISL